MRRTNSGDDPSTDCEFCRIARGRDPTVEIVCESEAWVAFFPTEPATPGHTMVIPRAHVANVWDLDSTLGAKLMGGVIRVGRAIEAALIPEGMNLISSSGAVAEQTVLHVHLHVVPRWRRDGIDRIWPPKRRMDEELKADVAAKIREMCSE